MDEIAAAAGVSKQTVYKQFTDKKQLLYEIVLGITGRAGQIATTIASLFDGMNDVEVELTELGRRYATAVLSPEVLQLRRLIVSEARAFPIWLSRTTNKLLDAGSRRWQPGSRSWASGVDSVSKILSWQRTISPTWSLGPLIDRAMFFPDDNIDPATIHTVPMPAFTRFSPPTASSRPSS